MNSAILLALLALQNDPTATDITVAGRPYEAGAALRLFTDDLARDGGLIVIRGKVDRRGYDGSLLVEVSLDAGLTWQKAEGEDPWTFSFRPTGAIRLQLQFRVTKTEPPEPPAPEVRLEHIQFLVNGRPIQPRPDGTYLYSGRVTVRGAVRNIGPGTVPNVQVDYEFDGERTSLVAPTELGTKEFTAELRDFKNQTATIRIAAGQEMEDRLFDWREFTFTPDAAGDGFQIRNPRAEGEYLSLDVLAPPDSIHYNVPVKVTGSDGGTSTSALSELHSGVWIPVMIPLGTVAGTIDLEIGADRFPGVASRSRFVANNFTDPMTIRLGELKFRVSPDPNATREAFYGKGKLVLPAEIGGVDAVPAAADIDIGSASSPLKLDPENNIIHADNVSVNLGQVAEVYRFGSLRVYLVQIILNTGGARIMGGVRSTFVRFGEYLPIDVAGVQSLANFHTTVSTSPIDVLGMFTGNAGPIHVDLSSTWSPKPVGDPGWKGLYIHRSQLKMGSVEVTLEKVRIAHSVDGEIRAVFPTTKAGGFAIMNLKAQTVMVSNAIRDWIVIGGTLQSPDWLTAAGAPAEIPLKGPGNRITEDKRLDLIAPRIEQAGVVQFPQVRIEWSSLAIDLSPVRALPGDWRPPSWQGILIDARVTFDGKTYDVPMVLSADEIEGDFIVGGTKRVIEDLEFFVKATVVHVLRHGDVEVTPADVTIYLPRGVTVGKGDMTKGKLPAARTLTLQKGSDRFMAASPDFAMTIPGKFTFAFSGLRAVGVDPAVDLSSTELFAGNAPATKGISLGTGTVQIPFGNAVVPFSGVYIDKTGVTGSFPIQGVSIAPDGWTGLQIAVDEARVTIERSALKEITILGKANLSAPLTETPVTVPFTSANLQRIAGGWYEFIGIGAFEDSQELPLKGNSKIHHLTDIVFDFAPNRASPGWTGKRDGWTGIMVRQGKLDLPPPLGGMALDLSKIEITRSGINGPVSSSNPVVINDPAGAAGVQISASTFAINFAANKIDSASITGHVKFLVGTTPFHVPVSNLRVESNDDGAEFGFVAESLNTDGAPFQLGGLELSLSSIGLDLSNLSNLGGVQGDKTWKGIRINNGSLRMPLKLASTSGTPVAFAMSGVAYPFGGRLSGRFSLQSPVRIQLLQPAGMEFELSTGWVDLADGAMTQSSLNGKVLLPSRFKGSGNARAEVAFTNLPVTQSGDIYIPNRTLSKSTFGGYAIASTTVTIDLSDAQSPANKPAGWKGLHFQSADLYVPSLGGAFKLVGADFAIGPDGFAGSISRTGQSIDATYAGFPITLSGVNLTFESSRVTVGELAGALRLPLGAQMLDIDLNADDTGIASATVESNQAVKLTGFGLDVQVQRIVFAATQTGGYVEIDGSMTLLQAGLNCPGIAVEGLKITNTGQVSLKSAWINLGNTCTANFSGFTIGVTQIGFGIEGNLRWFGISGEMSLVEVMSAKASALKIFINPNGTFAKLTCDEISVEVETAAVKISGKARLFDNQEEGRGFEGSLKVDFKTLKFSIDGYLLLGRKDNYTYFRVHIGVQLPQGIALGQTGISIYGFNGGVAYNMKFDPKTTTYSPQRGGWAVSAGITLGSTPDKGATWNGDFTLTIAMSPGSVSVTIQGTIWLMCPVSERNDNTKGGFTLSVTNTYLYGNAWFQINRQPICGITGTLEFYFPWSGQGWYIRIGTPQNRLTIRVLNSITGSGYFMADARSLRVGFSVRYSFWLNWEVIRGGFDLGFGADATLYLNPVWFQAGVWAEGYASIDVKIAGRWYSLVSVYAYGGCTVRAPNPTRVSGTLKFEFKILGVKYKKEKGFSKDF